MADRSLIARAEEIALKTPGKITTEAALAEAIRERYDNNPKLMAEFAAGMMRGALKDIRKNTYQLGEQPTLFDVPQTIVVSTPEGDLLIAKDDATAGQVEQWLREGSQWHNQQGERFSRLLDRHRAAKFDLEANYVEQVKALESGDE